MATTSESVAFDRGVRPMLEIVLPGKADAVIGFQADPDLQARIEELALACIDCNLHKGTNLTGIDPKTNALSSREDSHWQDYYSSAEY